MNITLVEERADGVTATERSFAKSVVVAGRDAAECDLVFDKAKYPMVSRRHAEIRWAGADWIVVDHNSTYGTFLDGSPVSSPQTLKLGSRIQLGKDGPFVRVITFAERSPSPVLDVNTQKPIPAAIPLQPLQPISPVQPAAPLPKQSVQSPQSARLVFVVPAGRPQFDLNKPEIWLGRDPACDIVFDDDSSMVSRRHAVIRVQQNSLTVEDNNSFNGTLVNGHRISAPSVLGNGDELQLGLGGPSMKLSTGAAASPIPNVAVGDRASSKTMVVNLGRTEKPVPKSETAGSQLLMSVGFSGKSELTVGREDSCDITLDGLQISKKHARFVQSRGDTFVEDLGSTNGIYVNGARATKQSLRPEDVVQIGSFSFRVDTNGNISVFDTRSKFRIDAVSLTRTVSGGKIKLLDGISLSIEPNEFVGLLGPSGAGKSTLMEALNGVRPATSGNVLVNDQDLYRNLGSLKQSIGYVPQEDIIHRELSVYRTLYFVAKLRLSRDVNSREIKQIVDEVLDITGLTERRDVQVRQLSGGQRKRVSIAVELITKPSVIFLDEPTSGLDPAAEDRIMRLFRQIAESGRTVVMTTHAMENVRLFDKIVVLMRGNLVFYGTPDAALKHLQAANFKELYDRLEEPVEAGIKRDGEASRKLVTEQTAEMWKQKFLRSPDYETNVHKPLGRIGSFAADGGTEKTQARNFRLDQPMDHALAPIPRGAFKG